ncbi:MAG: hypothetical protein RLZZ436_1172 [Planctomycetota bacterium]
MASPGASARPLIRSCLRVLLYSLLSTLTSLAQRRASARPLRECSRGLLRDFLGVRFRGVCSLPGFPGIRQSAKDFDILKFAAGACAVLSDPVGHALQAFGEWCFDLRSEDIP